MHGLPFLDNIRCEKLIRERILIWKLIYISNKNILNWGTS